MQETGKRQAVSQSRPSGKAFPSVYCRCCLLFSLEKRFRISLTLLGLQSRFGDNWGQLTWNLTGLSPKRDWSSKRDNTCFWVCCCAAAWCVTAPEHQHGSSNRPRQTFWEVSSSSAINSMGETVFKNTVRRFPKTGIFTPCPRFLPSRQVHKGIFLDAVCQGVNLSSSGTFGIHSSFSIRTAVSYTVS